MGQYPKYISSHFDPKGRCTILIFDTEHKEYPGYDEAMKFVPPAKAGHNPHKILFWETEETIGHPGTIKRENFKPLKRAPGERKIGRNDLCFCNSGLKYKKCCLHRKV